MASYRGSNFLGPSRGLGLELSRLRRHRNSFRALLASARQGSGPQGLLYAIY